MVLLANVDIRLYESKPDTPFHMTNLYGTFNDIILERYRRIA